MKQKARQLAGRLGSGVSPALQHSDYRIAVWSTVRWTVQMPHQQPSLCRRRTRYIASLSQRASAMSLQQITFPLRGEFITLDKLLKACNLASSGGHAKMIVAEGRVQVDGQDELRKTAKIRAGQVVSVQGARIRVVPEQDAEPPTA